MESEDQKQLIRCQRDKATLEEGWRSKHSSWRKKDVELKEQQKHTKGYREQLAEARDQMDEDKTAPYKQILDLFEEGSGPLRRAVRKQQLRRLCEDSQFTAGLPQHTLITGKLGLNIIELTATSIQVTGFSIMCVLRCTPSTMLTPARPPACTCACPLVNRHVHLSDSQCSLLQAQQRLKDAFTEDYIKGQQDAERAFVSARHESARILGTLEAAKRELGAGKEGLVGEIQRIEQHRVRLDENGKLESLYSSIMDGEYMEPTPGGSRGALKFHRLLNSHTGQTVPEYLTEKGCKFHVGYTTRNRKIGEFNRELQAEISQRKSEQEQHDKDESERDKMQEDFNKLSDQYETSDAHHAEVKEKFNLAERKRNDLVELIKMLKNNPKDTEENPLGLEQRLQYANTIQEEIKNSNREIDSRKNRLKVELMDGLKCACIYKVQAGYKCPYIRCTQDI